MRAARLNVREFLPEHSDPPSPRVNFDGLMIAVGKNVPKHVGDVNAILTQKLTTMRVKDIQRAIKKQQKLHAKADPDPDHPEPRAGPRLKSHPFDHDKEVVRTREKNRQILFPKNPLKL